MYDLNKDRSWQKGVSPSQRTTRREDVPANDQNHGIEQGIQKPQQAAAPNDSSVASPSPNTTWQKGVIPSQRTEQLRQRAQSVYQNDPAYGQVDSQGHGIDQFAEQLRQRAQSVYQNNPAYGQVDDQGHGTENDQKPQGIAAANNGASPSAAAKPSIKNDNGTKVAWTGKFVSEYGSHFDKEQGLIFKRTDGEGGLHHFTAAQASQMRANNKDLIDESLRNGSQGKDVKVTFSVNNGRGSWGVEPLSKQRI